MKKAEYAKRYHRVIYEDIIRGSALLIIAATATTDGEELDDLTQRICGLSRQLATCLGCEIRGTFDEMIEAAKERNAEQEAAIAKL